MNAPPSHPLSAVVDACSTTLGRCLAYCLAGLVPYLVMGTFHYISITALPVYILGSMLTGWGMLIYPALLLGCFAYVRFELSHWLLLLPVVVCALDLWRIVAIFSEA